MSVRHPVLTLSNLLAIAMLGMLVLGGSIYLGINLVVDQAVKVDAEQKARNWSAYFIGSMPDLDGLLVTGELNAEQAAVAAAAERLGGVFRYKLFDRDGDLVLVSDEAAYRAEGQQEREHSDKAATVLASGESSISLNDGTGKENRPPLYVEAYVPMVAADGSSAGVVEVYIDQTATAAMLRSSFAVMAVGLAILAALAFGLPTLAFLWRSKQAQEARDRAEFLTHHDAMTGLLNRDAIGREVEARLSRPEPVAVALLDVDDFKAINEDFGHDGGDDFLKHMARVLQSDATRGGLAGRLGGDQFVLILSEPAEAAVLETVETVRRTICQPVRIGGRMLTGRVSVGVHICEDAAESLTEIMHKAEVAHYQAKIDGGNACRLYDEEMESAMRSRRTLEQLIRTAVATKGFELHYQPLLHAGTRRCAGFEALLRLPDGEGGLIPPAEFIPVAESMGLITEIGNWVIGQATRTAASWPEDLFVSVNLSVRQFHDGRLVNNVQAALAAAGLPAGRLELEVTESMLMENTDGIAAQLRALRSLGVSIAMDDFGTGYSSLGYLWQFRFDKLKIDRSFVIALEVRDQQAREILDTIIMLGHKLDMTVTAEGIETERQARILTELACDHFQGYLYGRPVPGAEIAGFLLRNVREQVIPEIEHRAAKA